MELDDSDVLFSGGLLGLNEPGRVVDAHNEATSDLRIKGTRVAGLVDLEDFLDPGDDLVRGWVGGLVQVDHTILLEHLDGAVHGGEAAREGREVGSLDVELLEVLDDETRQDGYVKHELNEGSCPYMGDRDDLSS